MNKAILNKDAQDFINKNLNEPAVKTALQKSPVPGVSIQELVEQIESRKKSENKLPTWFNTSAIYYPNKLNIEQTSSEITAAYKAELITGKTIADITGGFGVDSFYFSKKSEKANHYELNDSLSEIAKHNFKQLQAVNIQCFAQDGITAIKNEFFDAIYVDPSRRHQTKGKVFFLNDCLPNVVEHKDYLLSRCHTLLIKTSPMLDIAVGLKELQSVNAIHIVAVNNEVKELLWIINPTDEDLEITAVNISGSKKDVFRFRPSMPATADYGLPKKYLYEPNVAILKSGAFNAVSEKFSLEKLHKNTHLYTSNTLVDFPGRRFEIEKIIPYNKKEIKSSLNLNKANITTRNFPEPVEAIRKKWQLKDGGDKYLFFITNQEKNKVILECRKI